MCQLYVCLRTTCSRGSLGAVNGGPLRVTVWGENLLEHINPAVRAIYPAGMHTTIAEAIRQHVAGANVTIATLDQREHGLNADVLAGTDVLTWWGHVGHDRVDDRVVGRIPERAFLSLGLAVLH